MSRSSEQPKGFYTINVFWQGKGLKNYEPYVSGLFDDVSQVSISLIDGYLSLIHISIPILLEQKIWKKQNSQQITRLKN